MSVVSIDDNAWDSVGNYHDNYDDGDDAGEVMVINMFWLCLILNNYEYNIINNHHIMILIMVNMMNMMIMKMTMMTTMTTMMTMTTMTMTMTMMMMMDGGDDDDDDDAADGSFPYDPQWRYSAQCAGCHDWNAMEGSRTDM